MTRAERNANADEFLRDLAREVAGHPSTVGAAVVLVDDSHVATYWMSEGLQADPLTSAAWLRLQADAYASINQLDTADVHRRVGELIRLARAEPGASMRRC